MEGLLALGVEFLIAPLVALVAIAIEAAVTLISFLIQLLFWFLDRKRQGAAPRFSSRLPLVQREVLRRWCRRAQRAFGIMLAVSLLALSIINFFFLDRVVAAIVRHVEKRTEIDIEYAAMEGNVFTGAFRFLDARVTRAGDGAASFDLKATEVAANLSMLDLMFGHRAFDAITLAGIEGSFVRHARPDDDPARLLRPRGSFTVGELTLTEADIAIADRSGPQPVSYSVHVTSAEARPLRSHYLWFDLLFRSNLQLTIDGTAVNVENRTEGAMRHTVWSATAIQAPVLASVVGGPFKLFTAGEVDVLARDSWRLGRDPEIDMQWTLTMRDAQAAVPEGTPPILHVPARVFAEHVNTRTEPWEFSFNLRLDEGRFAGAASLDAQQIWADTVGAFLRETVQLDSEQIENVKAKARAGMERFKDFIRKREEKAAEEAAPTAEPEN